MKAIGRIGPAIYLFGFAGAILFTFLLIREGAQDVIRAFAEAGWWLAVITGFHLIPLFLDSFEWWILFPGENRIRLRAAYRIRWIGESVSNLVPAAQVGGDILRARLAVLSGVPIPVATATVVVDITVSVFIQTFFTVLGLVLLILFTGRTNLMLPTLAGTPLAIGAVAGFYALQRLGMFRLFGAVVTRWATDPKWRSLVGKGGEIDQALRKVYARKGAIVTCCTVTTLSFVVGSVEVWIGLHAVGAPASFERALILESVGQGVQTALCLVPGALGVREGGYVVVGGLLGIPGDAAFALALIRRMRELAIGLPGLLVWQFVEGGHFWRSRSLRAVEGHCSQRPAAANSCVPAAQKSHKRFGL
jgi:putative membrane protein